MTSVDNEIIPRTSMSSDDDHDMEYDYKRAPRWYLTILLGVQHFLAMCPAHAIGTLILAEHLCLKDHAAIKSDLISTSFFVMGLSTLVQTIVGCNLPIIQGSSFAILIPCVTMMKLPDIQSCNVSDNRFIQDYFQNRTMPESMFHMKIRLINGALIVGSLVEVVVSITGVLKLLKRLISPLSLAAIYTVLCLAISESLIGMISKQWAIGITSMVVTMVLSAVLAPKPIPIPIWWTKSGWKIKRIKIFQISPIITALIIMWSLCGILTVSGALSKDPNGWGFSARTDIKNKEMLNSIVKVPYIMPWGPPIIIPSMIVGVTVGILLSVIESLGDYIVTSQVCRAPDIPHFAINRGILVEGIAVCLSGLFGSATAPTSYTENIGVLKMTKAGHKSIARVTAILMVLCGIFPIIGAVLVAIPNPIVGGVIFVPIMMTMSCAISNFQHVNLHSARNALVFGISVTMGIYLPQWCAKNQKNLETGYRQVDGIIQMLLSISLFIAFVISVFLDNVLPGYYNTGKVVTSLENESSAERKDVSREYTELERFTAYDPIFLKWVATKCTFLQYVPLFPSYRKVELKEQAKVEDVEFQNTNL